MQKKNLLGGLIFLIAAGSIGLNIYFVIKNNELKDKINGFLPQAISMEAENQRLKAVEQKQQQQLEDCAYSKDSLLQAQLKALPQQQPSYQDPLQQPPQLPVNNGTLKDLNKGF